MPFVKLDCGIIHSSLWAEDSDTKVCWITMLLLADATGFVRAAASAIAREAGIPAEVARRALELFSSPDDESRTPDNQGKRIEKVDGGYRVLNYEKYRERDYTNAERQKRFRESQKRNVTGVTPPLRSVTRNAASRKQKQSTEADKDNGANGSRPTTEDWLKSLEEDMTYQGINVREQYGKMLRWCEVNKKQPTQRRFINWLNRTDKPISRQHENGRKPYGKNYMPPRREPTQAEINKAREIARRESEAFRLKMNGGDTNVSIEKDSS